MRFRSFGHSLGLQGLLGRPFVVGACHAYGVEYRRNVLVHVDHLGTNRSYSTDLPYLYGGLKVLQVRKG